MLTVCTPVSLYSTPSSLYITRLNTAAFSPDNAPANLITVSSQCPHWGKRWQDSAWKVCSLPLTLNLHFTPGLQSALDSLHAHSPFSLVLSPLNISLARLTDSIQTAISMLFSASRVVFWNLMNTIWACNYPIFLLRRFHRPIYF